MRERFGGEGRSGLRAGGLADAVGLGHHRRSRRARAARRDRQQRGHRREKSAFHLAPLAGLAAEAAGLGVLGDFAGAALEAGLVGKSPASADSFSSSASARPRRAIASSSRARARSAPTPASAAAFSRAPASASTETARTRSRAVSAHSRPRPFEQLGVVNVSRLARAGRSLERVLGFVDRCAGDRLHRRVARRGHRGQDLLGHGLVGNRIGESGSGERNPQREQHHPTSRPQAFENSLHARTKPWRTHVVKCSLPKPTMSPPKSRHLGRLFHANRPSGGDPGDLRPKARGRGHRARQEHPRDRLQRLDRRARPLRRGGPHDGGRPLRAHHPRRGQRHHPGREERRAHRRRHRSTSPPRRAGAASR